MDGEQETTFFLILSIRSIEEKLNKKKEKKSWKTLNDKRERKKERKALRFIKVWEKSGKLKNSPQDILFSSLEKLRKKKKLKIEELRRRRRVE